MSNGSSVIHEKGEGKKKRNKREEWSLSCRVSREGMQVPVEKKEEIDDDNGKGIVADGERTIA